MTDSKLSFVGQVMANIQGGEEAKVERFHKQTTKWLAKQIALAKDKIEENDERIADRQEELDEIVIGIDMDRINKTDGIKSYTEDYIAVWDAKTVEIQALEAKNVELKKVVAKRQAQMDRLTK